MAGYGRDAGVQLGGLLAPLGASIDGFCLENYFPLCLIIHSAIRFYIVLSCFYVRLKGHKVFQSLYSCGFHRFGTVRQLRQIPT